MIVDTSASTAVLRREIWADQLFDRVLAAADPRVSAGTPLETRTVGGSAALQGR